MRALAITGIETVFMISRMMRMDAMRATPPSLRMSEGTRSSAITAHAPAFSAILACSTLVTSIMTPPFSISARPAFNRKSSDRYMVILLCSHDGRGRFAAALQTDAVEFGPENPAQHTQPFADFFGTESREAQPQPMRVR